MTIRVLIADDQELVRTGFRKILESEPDITVVGEACTGLEAVALASSTKPDVVLMDIRMPVLDGIEATRRLEGHIRVLILTTFDIDEYVFDALRAGASGFLVKDAPVRQLVDAIRIIAGGEALLSPSVTRRLIEAFIGRRPRPSTAISLDSLTPRELEVLAHMAKGLSNREIAERLFVGDSTVKTHVARIFQKLHLRDRAQAVVVAYESGLVTPGLEGADP